jgi:CheY-like chemotaxis protein
MYSLIFLLYAASGGELDPKRLKTLQQHLYFQYKKFTLPIHSGLDFFELFEFESEVATVYIEEDTEDSLKKLQNILLVEDQAEVIEEISILLSSQYGITVRVTADVNDVNEVINIAQSGEIDFILVNDHLPNIRYEGREVNGIKLVRLLRSNPQISPYLPVIGFSHHISKKNEFLQEADGFYSKADILERKEVQQFIDYLRKIFNRVKITEILPYESKSDLDSVLYLMSKRHSEGLDTSGEEVANLFGKHKNDDGTYYLLENLSLLSILNRKSGHDVEPGTVKYDLSNDYLKQESPRPLSLPEIEEFETIKQQLYDGQKKLLKEIEKRNKEQQTISQAYVAFLFRFFRTYTVENSPSSLSVQQCSKVDKYQSNKNSKPYCTSFTSMSC